MIMRPLGFAKRCKANVELVRAVRSQVEIKQFNTFLVGLVAQNGSN